MLGPVTGYVQSSKPGVPPRANTWRARGVRRNRAPRRPAPTAPAQRHRPTGRTGFGLLGGVGCAPRLRARNKKHPSPPPESGMGLRSRGMGPLACRRREGGGFTRRGCPRAILVAYTRSGQRGTRVSSPVSGLVGSGCAVAVCGGGVRPGGWWCDWWVSSGRASRGEG
jgi:hypothetical protein